MLLLITKQPRCLKYKFLKMDLHGIRTFVVCWYCFLIAVTLLLTTLKRISFHGTLKTGTAVFNIKILLITSQYTIPYNYSFERMMVHGLCQYMQLQAQSKSLHFCRPFTSSDLLSHINQPDRIIQSSLFVNLHYLHLHRKETCS